MKLEEALAVGKAEANLVEDPDDLARLDYLNMEIDEIIVKLKEPVFTITAPLAMFSVPVVADIKRNRESEGWTVGVFGTFTEGGQRALQMVFARARGASLFAKVAPPAEEWRPNMRQERGDGRRPNTSTPLLIRMPTRWRPEQALATLTAYRKLAKGPVAIEVVIDEDDELMNDSRVLQRLYDLDCSICVGRHRNKVAAVNGGIRDDWEVLVLASDDMVPIAPGYDGLILGAMATYWPLGDGAIYFDDGYNKSHQIDGKPILCTLPVIGRHFYDQFGSVYYPGYGSLFCDNEQTELWTAMGRLRYVEWNEGVLIEHRHHAAGRASFDALYKHNDETYGAEDRTLFQQRSELRRPGAQFAFDSPPMQLSILIASTLVRHEMLAKLTAYLRDQMRLYPREVELLVEIDDGEISIGEKRQKLLERAVGHFVAFVDDDDWVSHDYVRKILDAIDRQPEADCVSLRGIITTNGADPRFFDHSIDNPVWEERDGEYKRSPNHLNPVRREIALAVGFPLISFGEDKIYSDGIQARIKSEAKTEGVLYHYWYRTKKGVGQ
jgi:hypothetical protein